MLKHYFDNLTPEEIAVIESMLEFDAHARGAIFIEQFSIPKGFYMLTNGKARIYQLTTLAKTLCALQVAEISAEEPDLLCETDILMNSICSFTAVAMTDVELQYFPVEKMAHLRESHPDIVLKIYQKLAQKMAFKYMNHKERTESRIVASATNAHTAIAILKKYIGNVNVCTPQMALKLFKIDSPVL